MAQSTKISRSLKIYLDGKEVTNSVKDIRAEMRQVKRDLENAQVGSDDYRRSMEKLGTLNSILNEHKNKLKEIKYEGDSIANKAKNWFKEGFAYAISFASLDALKNKLLEFRDLFNQKESSAANLKALTGLDDSSIQWLTDQAERLSTTMDETGLRITQTSQEILEAYMFVGSAKPELLSDKEALNAVTIEAMRLAQAAKMDLKDAVNGVTLALNQYGAGADEAARYVNVLAAGSKAGAADVQSQTAAIIKAGVAASTAGIPIEQLVGSIETLAEKGIKSEVAGTGLKTFFLKLETMAEDCRPSVVGLQTALENLAAKNMTTEQMMEAFGEGTYTVAQAMISSADSFREYTAAVTNTSVAIEQAAINSDTTEVKMAQLTNMINEQGMAIWEALAPAYNVLLQGLSSVMGVLSSMIGYITQHIGLIGTLTAGIILYNTHATAAKVALLAWNTVKTAAIALSKAWTVQLNLSNLATKRYLVSIKSANVLTQTYTATTMLLRAAFYTVTGSLGAARTAMVAFNTAVKANPLGILITAVTTIVGLFSIFSSSEEEATEKTEELNQAQDALIQTQQAASQKTAEEKTRIEELSRIIHDNAASYDDKKRAIAELQKIVPGYQASLSREGVVLKENVKAIEDYIRKLDKMAMAEAAYEKVVEINKKILDKTIELNTNSANLRHLTSIRPEKYESAEMHFQGGSYSYDAVTEEWKDWKQSIDDGIEAVQTGVKEIDELQGSLKQVTDYVRADKELSSLYDNLVLSGGRNPAAAPLGGGAAAVAKPRTSGGGTTPRTTGRRNVQRTGAQPGKPTGKQADADEQKRKEEEEKRMEEEKRIREDIEAIELDHNKKLNDIKERYRKGDIQSEEQYQQEVETLLVDTLKRKMGVVGLPEEKQVELIARMKDVYVRHRQELNQLLANIDNEVLSHDEQQRKAIDSEEQAKLVQLQQYRKQGILSEEKYQDAVLKVQQAAAEKRKEAWRNSEEYQEGINALNKYLQTRTQAFQEANTNEGFGALKGIDALKQEIETVKTYMQSLSPDSPEYQALEEYMNGLETMMTEKGKAIIDITGQIGESIGSALGEAISGSKDGVKNALKSLINIILDGIEKMILASMTIPAIEALAGPGGWAKAATTLAKIAVIKMAFAAVKSQVQNFSDGGFTGTGKWDEPRGIVHAGEFVANRFALQNPAVRPLIDLIDSAQRTGNIRNLTADDIAAVATPSAHSHYRNRVTVADRDTQRLLAATTEAVNQLTNRLNQPIIAHTHATGKYGTIEAENLVRKMQNNSRRRNQQT